MVCPEIGLPPPHCLLLSPHTQTWDSARPRPSCLSHTYIHPGSHSITGPPGLVSSKPALHLLHQLQALCWPSPPARSKLSPLSKQQILSPTPLYLTPLMPSRDSGSAGPHSQQGPPPPPPQLSALFLPTQLYPLHLHLGPSFLSHPLLH